MRIFWRKYKQLRSLLLVWLVGKVLPLIRMVYILKPFPYSHHQLRCMPAGCLGATVARYLDNRGFDLVADYEIHDIKHILYGYEMDAEGEVRLQSFLFGTGNYGLPVLGTMALGFVLMPDCWLMFAHDMLRGRFSGCDADPDFSALLHLPLEEARQRAGIHDHPYIHLMPPPGSLVTAYA